MKGEAPMTPADLDRVEREFKVARGNSGHDGLAYWATRRARALIATIRRQQEALEMAEGVLKRFADLKLPDGPAGDPLSSYPNFAKLIDVASSALAQIRAVKADGGAK